VGQNPRGPYRCVTGIVTEPQTVIGAPGAPPFEPSLVPLPLSENVSVPVMTPFASEPLKFNVADPGDRAVVNWPPKGVCVLRPTALRVPDTVRF